MAGKLVGSELGVGEFLEVDYFQRELTGATKFDIIAEVNAKLADGWKIIHTSSLPVAGATSVAIFHVFAR